MRFELNEIDKKTIISFSNVVKLYANKVFALHGVSFDIQEGEFVFLMGASGAGKSTLIKLLMKEEKATCGTIMVGDQDLGKIRGRKIPKYRRNIGVVFQDFRLLDNKNVYENVAFAMEIVGASPTEISRRVELVLRIVGLLGKEKRYPRHLSGGEQQRVALARAIVNTPSILIADEPTGNLDPENSREIMKILEKINERGTTVLVATHEEDLVKTMNKRIVYLDHGLQREELASLDPACALAVKRIMDDEREMKEGGDNEEETMGLFIHN